MATQKLKWMLKTPLNIRLDCKSGIVAISGVSFEKEKNALSKRVLDFFERTRYSYLSAKEDPSKYGKKWRATVKSIRESFDGLDSFTRVLKKYIDEDTVFDDGAEDPNSTQAKRLYDAVKEMRFQSKEVSDPFAKRFKGSVLEELLDNPETMLKFIHYALRNDKKVLEPSILAVKDIEPDDITVGLSGLDLEVDDISLYIIEHYGGGKDSKKVESKVKAGMELLDLLMLSKNSKEELEELKDIEKSKTKSGVTEKSISDFIIPNKPMYRIFEIDDIKELKGFSGEWYVQEKYDGMRVQLHKIDNNIKESNMTEIFTEPVNLDDRFWTTGNNLFEEILE